MGYGNFSDQQSDLKKEANVCDGPCHAERILQVLNSYRKSGTFTDVVLRVDSSEFPCHRAALCASSNYFSTMFTGQLRESRQSVISIHGVTAVSMETVLSFLYEGRVKVDEENVVGLFTAADLLGLKLLSKSCVRFLEEGVEHSNCLGLMDFASSYFLEALAVKCEKMLYRDFVKVCQHDEFLGLEKERVVGLLTSEQLQCEEVLVEAVLKWVHHDPGQRKGALRELLELARLPLLDPVFLLNTVEADTLVQECRECRQLLLEARRYHLMGREVDSERTKPKREMGRAEMIVVIGGCDRNGIARLTFTEKLNPYTQEWMSGATLPGYSKSEFASCELQNDIYVSGGQLNSSDVWKYISNLDHWVRVAPLAQGRWRHKMASLLGKLYVIGGYNGTQRLSSVECYSVYNNQWRTVAPLPLAVSSAAVVGCAGKLYVIGGAITNDANTNKVQCYDPTADQWSNVTPCPFSQRGLAATTLNNVLYVVGGLLDEIYSYTPKTDTWNKVVDLPKKVEGCGLTMCEGKVFVVGGSDEFARASDHIWIFSPESGTLTKGKSMSRSVSHHGCVTVTQRLP